MKNRKDGQRWKVKENMKDGVMKSLTDYLEKSKK